MPFTKGDPRAAAAGRKAMTRRWGRASADDRAVANQRMTAARLARYRDTANEQATRMGLHLTQTQAEAAARSLFKADLRDRLAAARSAKAEHARLRHAAEFERLVASLGA